MIYTVTLNPSLDYTVTVEDFAWGKTNRTATEELRLGGKGLNVSTVLQHMGVESVALGFVAGFTGREIERLAGEQGLACEFVTLPEGNSRINIKLQDVDGTEINGRGPEVSPEAWERFFAGLDRLAPGDVLVLAGSVPSGADPSLYRVILERLQGRGVECVVDAAGELLQQVLPFRPFLVKPNNQELGELFGVTLPDRASVIPYARELQRGGAKQVMVSLAGEGAVFLDEAGRVYECPAPKGQVISGVGAGDSMVAGFLAGLGRGLAPEEAFRLGVAAGSATTFSKGLATAAEIRQVYQGLTEE